MPRNAILEADALRRTELFADLDTEQAARLVAIARPAHARKGAYVFLLGDHADRLYVVLSGRAELTFPLMVGGVMRDVPVESKLPGSALGWSALVKPYRFTLSARAADSCQFATFLRQDLLRVFGDDMGVGYIFMKRIAELVGHRLLLVQALWARQVQRTVEDYLNCPQDKAGREV